MTDDHLTDDSDPRLRRLLSDAVSDVEPRDALPDIRVRARGSACPSHPGDPHGPLVLPIVEPELVDLRRSPVRCSPRP